MAKKTIGNIFNKTSSAPAAEGKEAKPKPYGVYLNAEMRADIEKIRAALGMNNHELLQFAIKYFIQQYKAGKVKMKTETVTRPEL